MLFKFNLAFNEFSSYYMIEKFPFDFSNSSLEIKNFNLLSKLAINSRNDFSLGYRARWAKLYNSSDITPYHTYEYHLLAPLDFKIFTAISIDSIVKVDSYKESASTNSIDTIIFNLNNFPSLYSYDLLFDESFEDNIHPFFQRGYSRYENFNSYITSLNLFDFKYKKPFHKKVLNNYISPYRSISEIVKEVDIDESRVLFQSYFEEIQYKTLFLCNGVTISLKELIDSNLTNFKFQNQTLKLDRVELEGKPYFHLKIENSKNLNYKEKNLLFFDGESYQTYKSGPFKIGSRVLVDGFVDEIFEVRAYIDIFNRASNSIYLLLGSEKRSIISSLKKVKGV